MRRTLESASLPLLLRLQRLPRLVVVLVLGALFFGGLIAPNPFGPLLLGVVTVFVAWLVVLSLPTLTLGRRLTRLLLVGMLIGLVVVRAITA